MNVFQSNRALVCCRSPNYLHLLEVRTDGFQQHSNALAIIIIVYNDIISPRCFRFRFVVSIVLL